MKPKFYRQPPEVLIKSMRLWERLSIDFKGLLDGKNKYQLMSVDEYSVVGILSRLPAVI